MNLKSLTEKEIKQFAGSTIYGRGRDYFKDGMVFELDFDDVAKVITAGVYGNYGDYEVEVSFTGGDFYAECDCPYDGYPCKHVVAVLLSFLHNREEYIQEKRVEKKKASGLKNQLKELPKDELVELVLTCAKKYSDFKRELLVRFEADKKTTLETILKQVQNAFPSVTSRSYSLRDAVKKLKVILKSVEDANAKMKIEVNWAVADRVLDELNEYGIDDEATENVAITAFETLVKCQHEDDSLAGKKHEIIDTLMDYYIRGNCGMTDMIFDTAHELCSDESDVRMIIDKLKSHTGGRSYYKTLLASLYESIDEDEAVLKTLEQDLEYGMGYWRLAQYWLKKDNFEKALEVVQEGIRKGEGRKDELYQFMTNYYTIENRQEEIYQLLLNKIENNEFGHWRKLPSDETYKHLDNFYRSQNDYDGQKKLLNLCQQQKHYDFELYKTAKKALNKTDWPVYREKIIAELRQAIAQEKDMQWWRPKSSDEKQLLAQIYAHEKDLEALFELIKESIDLLVKYEKKLIPLHPEFYLKKYQGRIDKLIDLRGRGNYQDAVKYTKTVKRIYEQELNRPKDFQIYLAQIKMANKQLRALHEELRVFESA